NQLPAIDRALRQVLCHDDLRFCVNGSLGVVGLHEPVLALHDAAVGIGEVLLGFGIWLSGGWGGFRSGFPTPFGFSLLLRLGLCFALGFGRLFRLRLQVCLGLADRLGTPL